MDIPPASGNGTASPIEHDVDPVSCSLLGTVGLVVQGLMGLFVIASLLFKRQYEGDKKKGKRRRKWRVWMMDVGKQLIGQGMVHGLNLLVSRALKCHRQAFVDSLCSRRSLTRSPITATRMHARSTS